MGIRDNPGKLARLAEAGELTLIINRSNPVSASILFSRDFPEQGIRLNMASKLFQDGVLTLVLAAKVAQSPVESFLEKLALLGIVAVDFESDELVDELGWLDQSG